MVQSPSQLKVLSNVLIALDWIKSLVNVISNLEQKEDRFILVLQVQFYISFMIDDKMDACSTLFLLQFHGWPSPCHLLNATNSFMGCRRRVRMTAWEENSELYMAAFAPLQRWPWPGYWIQRVGVVLEVGAFKSIGDLLFHTSKATLYSLPHLTAHACVQFLVLVALKDSDAFWIELDPPQQI